MVKIDAAEILTFSIHLQNNWILLHIFPCTVTAWLTPKALTQHVVTIFDLIKLLQNHRRCIIPLFSGHSKK